MIDLLYKGVFALLLFKLFMTMYQRKFNETGGYKRLVSLYQSVLIGIAYIVMSSIKAKGFNENLIVIVFIVAILILVLLRKQLFPYKAKCEKCQKKLKLFQILFLDSQACSECEDIN